MAEASSIVTDVNGEIAVIRLNRPRTRNALSLATLNELANAFSSLSVREKLRAIIFTGTDDVFASGADIRELVQLDNKRALEFARFGQRLFQSIADSKQRTIAAINGYCMGGGLDLALACDIRIASPQAVFQHPGARLGIITGWGGTQRLHLVIGRARALECFVTARHFNAYEALTFGLVREVADSVLECAIGMSKTMAK